MNTRKLTLWFSLVSVVGALWGIVFAFFGLGVLAPFNTEVLVPWGNGVYGATLIGLSATFFFAGRHAFRKDDRELMKALLYGLFIWLIIEASFSLYYGVLLNVGVDIGIAILWGAPLLKGIRQRKE